MFANNLFTNFFFSSQSLYLRLPETFSSVFEKICYSTHYAILLKQDFFADEHICGTNNSFPFLCPSCSTVAKWRRMGFITIFMFTKGIMKIAPEDEAQKCLSAAFNSSSSCNFNHSVTTNCDFHLKYFFTFH